MRIVLQAPAGLVIVNAIHIWYNPQTQLLIVNYTEDQGYEVSIPQHLYESLVYDTASNGCQDLSQYNARHFTHGPTNTPVSPINSSANNLNFFE